MKCFGVIAEWNPLHRGHLLLPEAARAAGASHLVGVMSGNFTERGEPALCPWRYRVRAALHSGFDLVLQLPLPYAAATAERFASGGIRMLTALGVVDTVFFGSEAGETAPLWELADLLDSPALSEGLRAGLSAGLPFPAARERAAAALLGEERAALLREPNNILAIEYLAAIRRQKSPLEAMTLRRAGAGHDSRREDEFPSAGLLRKKIRAGDITPPGLAPAMEEELLEAEAAGELFDPRLWERPLLMKLRSMSEEDFAVLPDLSEGLEHRLYRESRRAGSLGELLPALKTRRYSHARLRRLLLSAALSVPRDLVESPIPYLRVLGFNARGEEILRAAKGRAALPLSPSLAVLARGSETAERFARLEERATDLYYIGTEHPAPCGEEFTMPVIRV